MTQQIIVCDGVCTVTVQHEISIPPFNIDAAEGAQIGFAIVLVWAAGLAFRLAIRTLNVDASSTEKED